MTKVISVYSVAPSQGKRTLSLSLAKQLSENDYRVLYVEMDYKNPSVAASTLISHSQKNAREYFQNTVITGQFDFESYIINKSFLYNQAERNVKSVLSELPSKLDFLSFSEDYEETNFPTILKDDENKEKQAHDYVSLFIHSLRSANYDYVILNVPNSLNSIFGFNVLLQSDQVINVLTPSVNRLMEYRKIKKFLTKNAVFDEKWLTVLNMVDSDINIQEYYRLLPDEDLFLMPYDMNRQKAELALEIGSDEINLKMAMLADSIGISIEQPIAKKKKYFLRG